MLHTLAALLVFQAIGEVLSYALRLPIPGPVLGMALLLCWLLLDANAAQRMRATSLELLKHLSLLFVPAGVGVMLHASRLADEALAVGVALIASTLLAIAVTALVIRWTSPHLADDSPPAPAAREGESQ
jgi:holin-like protein